MAALGHKDEAIETAEAIAGDFPTQRRAEEAQELVKFIRTGGARQVPTKASRVVTKERRSPVRPILLINAVALLVLGFIIAIFRRLDAKK